MRTNAPPINMLAKFIAFLLIFRRVDCILTRSGNDVKTERKGAGEKDDAVSQQSIARGFSYGDDHFGGYGVTPTGVYGEGYDHFEGNFEPTKYYGYEEHYKHEQKEHDPAYYKALAIKGLLIPLAGVALLSAAAAFVTNPVLLQLGVITSTYGRRKRDLTHSIDSSRNQALEKYHEIQFLERFMAQELSEPAQSREKKLFADYLSCSGMTDSCLERLACELHSSYAASVPDETNVMAIITNEILSNKFVSEDVKSRTAKAVKLGKGGDDCRVYECGELEMLINHGQ